MTDRAAVEEIAAEKLIAAGWADVRAGLPLDTPDALLRTHRLTFYAGANFVFCRVLAALGDDGDAALLEAINAELTDYCIELKGQRDGQTAR